MKRSENNSNSNSNNNNSNNKISLVATPKRDDKYFSSDEEIWESKYEPITNVFSCGWLEDGRCGYTPLNNINISSNNSNNSNNSFSNNSSHNSQLYQLCPRPIPHLIQSSDSKGRIFVCKKASAGSRHTLLLMINCIKEKGKFGRKSKKLVFFGLNQGFLCEEDGVWSPEEVDWDTEEEPPIEVVAGYGNCFIITKSGNVFSFGLGNYGVLGHGDDETWQIPRQIMSLNKHRVKQIALGKWHTLCMTYAGKLFTWGRNNRGQLGRGFISDMELEPGLAIEINTDSDQTLKISAGVLHSAAIVRVKRKDNSVSDTVYVWGEYQQCQLSSADIRNYTKPQPLRWVMKFLQRYEYTPIDICCGGYHNLLLFAPVRQILSWGGGEYGQLGDGYAWDNPKPQVVPNVKNVISMSAGLRHSVAVCGVGGTEGIPEVWVWGDNSYGQLGLGDTNIRLQPTQLSACKKMRVLSVSAGDRHTIFVTSHKPLLAKDYPILRDFFKILEEGASRMIKNRMKLELKRNGLDPELLNDPEKIMEDQAGKTDQEILNEDYEPGLKYCMDTRESLPSLQWRRKGLECAYQCPSLGLKAICMACARRCHSKRYLTLYLRKRLTKNDYSCDCRLSGNCLCCWTKVREKIDYIIENKDNNPIGDGCLGPNLIRTVLTYLRSPIPVDGADVEECLMVLANGDEETDIPRIQAVAFEKWYRQHYQEFEEDD